MADRSVHYEAAFEDYLRRKGWPYVAVDEAKKAAFAGASLKNFDFLVYSSAGANLLVDVKGRKFPDTSRPSAKQPSRAWENWISQDDVEGLAQWEEVFGEGFRATLVFAYWLQGPPQTSPLPEVHLFRGRCYTFAAIPLSIYGEAARVRSRRWRTLTMHSRQFALAVRDVGEFL